MRDRLLENWKFTEMPSSSNNDKEKDTGDTTRKALYDFGSGYPSDPKCKAWMENNPLKDPVFGFSDIVRFSWAPTKNRLLEEEQSKNVLFKADLDEDEEDCLEQQKGMKQFLAGGSSKKRKRVPYFDKRNIQVTNSIAFS
jgi:ribonuclease H2 subunit A